MNWLRPLTPILALAAVAWLSGGAGSCSMQAAPQLIQVREVVPTDVELGDRIAIVGEGFPAGKQARVTFRGELHRPGERPTRDAEIVVQGAVVGPEQVEVGFGESIQALFCGPGDRSAHTTFEGEVEVAFAAAAVGAPPVAGALRQVVLDVRPSARDREFDPEGERVLGFVGLKVALDARRGIGLAVDAVLPGSRAEASGIVAGDILATFDGLRVDSVGDLVPAPGEREAIVGIRHAGGAAVAPHTLSVDGFRQPPAAELLGSALLVMGALAIALLFGAPARPSLASAIQRVVGRMRGGGVFTSALGEVLPPAAAPGLIDLAACMLLAAMPFGQYLVAAHLDVGLIFVAGATALAVVAFVAGGSALGGMRAAAHVAWQHVPAAVALASVVLTTGSLRVHEIERAQGGWPWDWLAFRSPAALVALALLLACALVEPDASTPPRGLSAFMEDAAATRPPGVPGARRTPWLNAACRAHRIVIAGLASALFLGGWSLPGLSPVQEDARPLLELVGAAWLLAKTGAIVLALAWARRALPRRLLAERTRATALRLLPLSVLALAATAVWTWWSPGRSAQLLVSGSLVMLGGFVALALAQRLRHGELAAGADGHLSSFL
jgi:NADH-quinone oxidoreductase subunit H